MRNPPVLLVALSVLIILAAVQPAQAQTPLTLSQAVEIALEKNPTRKAARADQQVAAADIRDARSNLWPRLQFVESFTRSNDPVFAFGTKLRQQRFTADDFDLARLNTPTPVNNFNTRFAANWNVFDFRETWLDVARAERLHQAAGRQLERTEQELVFRVVDAYFSLLLALKQLEVADDAVRTAEANLDRSRARFEAGLVVESDLLSAQVNLAARQQERIRADNTAAVARVQLNHELGVPAESAFAPAEVLAERSLPVATLEELEARALAQRPDLEGVRLAEAAQEKSVEMARAAFGPRVNVVAGWEANNQSFLGNGGTNWLGGVEVQFDIFQGGAKQARLARERSVRDRLAAVRTQATSAVHLEVRRAYLDLGAARQQVEVARASVAQAQESLRIIQNRYEAGLTTITDLLRAEEATRRSQTQYWEAVYRWQVSYANLELATGTLNASSPVVTP
jgi:outer membrane protein